MTDPYPLFRKHELDEALSPRQLLPSQRAFIFAPERFSMISGGFACVAAETLIEGIPIAERKREDVATFYGRVRPSDPFLKGRADLYRIRTMRGAQAVVTTAHRFLTPTGWHPLAYLRAGDVVAGDDISSARSATGKSRDSRGYYCQDFNRSGESLSPEEVDAQGKLRQLRKTFFGDNAFSAPFFHHDKQSSVHLSPLSVYGECPSALGIDALFHPAWKNRLALWDTWLRSLSAFLRKGIEELLPRLVGSVCVESRHNSTSVWDVIQDVSFVRNGDFYDMQVPFAEHYSAGGLWHHNSGKTHAVLTKGLILSAIFPGNVGAFLCYRGSDAEKRLWTPFLEDVCPPRWIKKVNKNKRIIVLRNNSVISFEHIKDSSGGAGTGTRRIGANWGWFGVSQTEEITKEQWDALISRLRLPRAPKKFGFGDMNPAGHDWLWERFFRGVQPWPRDAEKNVLPIDGKYYQPVKSGDNILGISVNSLENRVSNSGFVEDAFFDSLLETYGEAWVNRFVYGSFDDFKGRLFNDFQGGLTDFNDASVHVVEDFPIPKHWQLTVPIDVGGDSPWAVVPVYVDEQGNLIVTNGFHNRTGRISEVANWVKRNTPYNETRTRFIIDPENPVATVELSEHGIYASPAQKAIMAGLLRLEGYLHVQKHLNLPHWYEETQPQNRTFKFRGKGSPKMFVMKSAMVVRRELDGAKWHPDKPDQMYKSSTARFDAVEALRYCAMEHPEPSKISGIEDAKFIEMAKKDPATAAEWREYSKRRAARRGTKAALRDMDTEDDAGFKELNVPPNTRYDWAEE